MAWIGIGAVRIEVRMRNIAVVAVVGVLMMGVRKRDFRRAGKFYKVAQKL